jgi:hypothetical protein
VAAEFADRWARSDLAADYWWSAIAPLCEPAFAERLRTVDPRTLPAKAVTGPPVRTTAPSVGVPAIYHVPTDGGTLVVIVAAIRERWLVSGNDFMRKGR